MPERIVRGADTPYDGAAVKFNHRELLVVA
jgi:hypothetical protein